MAVNDSFIVQCASCKKFRINGIWIELKNIDPNTDISHGICSDCVFDLYPEFAEIITAQVA